LSGTPAVRESHFFTFSQSDVDKGFLELEFPPKLVGYRVVYTNGSVTQTSFLIQSDLKTNGDNARYNSGGALITGDFKKEVALGNIPNYLGGSKFGLVQDLDGADAESTVWALANDTEVNKVVRKTFPTASGTLYMCSTSASDTAKEITLQYHDANNIKQSVSVDLNGQTSVDCGVTALDCNVAFITEPDGALVGDIFITLTDNFSAGGVPNTLSDTIAFIPQAAGRTQQATMRVPADTNLLLETMYITCARASGSDGSAVVYLRHKPAGKAWYVLRPYVITNQNIIDRKEDLTFGEGDFIEITVDDISDADTTINVVFDYELVQI
jgi:hypothetical protein